MSAYFAPPRTAALRAAARSLFAPSRFSRLCTLACLCAPWPVLALSVGTPQLLSAYGQPLRVEVPVSLAPEELAAGSLSVRMVPEADYGRYGVADQHLDPNLISARYDEASGRIELQTMGSVQELAAVLLLQVSLGDTRVIKEVPLLFDMPTQHSAPAPQPAVQVAAPPATAPDNAGAAPAAAVDVAATPAAPAEPTPRHHHNSHAASAGAASPARVSHVAAPATAALPPHTGLFQLAEGLDLNQAQAQYTSYSSGLRLAQSFDSYTELQRSQPAAQAAVPAAPQPVPQPVPAPQPAAAGPAPEQQQPAAAPPAHKPQAAAVPPPEAPHRSPLWLVLSGALLGAALWLLLRRRSRPQPAAPAVIAAAAPVPVPAAQPAKAVAAAPADDGSAPLRERLRGLTRGKLDPDLARRALLVEAFLDLKRTDSAARLLEELERDVAAAAPRASGADIAAAVRR